MLNRLFGCIRCAEWTACLDVNADAGVDVDGDPDVDADTDGGVAEDIMCYCGRIAEYLSLLLLRELVQIGLEIMIDVENNVIKIGVCLD